MNGAVNIAKPHFRIGGNGACPQMVQRRCFFEAESYLSRFACAKYIIRPTSAPPTMLPRVTGIRFAVKNVPKFKTAVLSCT